MVETLLKNYQTNSNNNQNSSDKDNDNVSYHKYVYKGEWITPVPEVCVIVIKYGVSVQAKKINGKDIFYCEKFRQGQGVWTTLKHTATHRALSRKYDGGTGTITTTITHAVQQGNPIAVPALSLKLELKVALATLRFNNVGPEFF